MNFAKFSIVFFGEFEDNAANEPNTLISMKVYVGEVIGEPTISSEIEEQKWFGRNESPEILSPIIRNKIFPALVRENII